MANKLLKTLNFGGTDTYDLAPNWKYVEDKPFGYEVPTGGDTLTWDGKTTGLDNVLGVLFHVSDATPTVVDGSISIGSTTTSFTESDVNDMGEGVKFIIVNSMPMVVIVPSSAVGVTVDGLKFNKQGVYFRNAGGEYVSSLTINGCKDFPSLAPIPTEYLPKSLQFGSEVVSGELMPLVELVPMGGGMFVAPVECPMLTDGNMYTVVWNGIAYNTLCYYLEGASYIGNVEAMMGIGDTGEPFVAITAIENGEVMFVGVSLYGEETVTMSLSGEVEVVTKIDAKFLPNSLRVICDLLDDGSFISMTPFEEIREAYLQGLNVYLYSPFTGSDVALNYFMDTTIMFMEMCDDQTLREYRIWNTDDNLVTHTQYDLSKLVV